MKKILPVLSAVLMLTGCGYTVESSIEEATENLSSTEELTETVPEKYTILYDIQLRSSQTEFLIDQDDHEIIWYAEIPVDYQPDIVNLVDADTGEVVAELRDEADYEKYGDTIKGDSVYNCRFLVDTDIDTDPDVSEDKYYHYYAEFIEGHAQHRSETVDIWVVEQFTDKELDDMEAVDNAIFALRQSTEYQNSSDTEKHDLVISLLKELAETGTPDRPYSLIIPESIHDDESTISFLYACDVGGGVMLKDFDPMMN